MALLSCSREAGEEDSSEPEGKVTIRFDVSVPLDDDPTMTKADASDLKEEMPLNTLHVAVFGGSGYLKEYVTATLSGPLEDEDENSPAGHTYKYYPKDEDGNYILDANNNAKYYWVARYSFSVTLTMATKARQIHFIGNGPETISFGAAKDVLPILMSNPGEGSYWQMIDLEKGIRANPAGVDSYEPYDDDSYLPDETTAAAFKHIALIRNWAKIEIMNNDGSNFTPKSFAVVNVPAQGTIVPYSASTQFINQYQNKSFVTLYENMKYPGNLPSGTEFFTAVPEAKYFMDLSDPHDGTYDGGLDAENNPAMDGGGVARVNQGENVYLYERPAPSGQIPATYVIVYGYYYNDSDGEREATAGNYYYKIDLMDRGKYYPILRNFKYRISIKKIVSQGQATPEQAAVSAGSADVSSDVSTSLLTDISDGISRLVVSPKMAETYTRDDATYRTFSVVFFPDATDTEDTFFYPNHPANHPSAVFDETNADLTLELDPAEGFLSDVRLVTEDIEDNGYIPITFTIPPGKLSDLVQKQVIRVVGHHPYDEGTIHRDIEITLQSIQDMELSIAKDRILRKKGTEQAITIKIPDGLTQSLFPLQFTIEAEDMTLEPDKKKANNNLPISYGTSISGSGKQAYQFIRTVTWQEYKDELNVDTDANDYTWREIPCYFLTNQDESATRIWVSNPFFNKQSITFRDYKMREFNNLTFTSSIPLREDAQIGVSCTLEMDEYLASMGIYPDILISPVGLVPYFDGWSPGPTPGTYYYTPTSANVNLTFMTQTDDGDISLSLSSEEYNLKRIVAGRFNQYIAQNNPENMPEEVFRYTYGLLEGPDMTNVAYGKVNNAGGKNVVFGYYDDPDALNASITIMDINRTPLTKNSNANISNLYIDSNASLSFPMTPTGPKNTSGVKTYHEITLKTKANNNSISFILSAPGYVEQAFEYRNRFAGRIHTMQAMNSTWLNTNFSSSSQDFDYYDEKDYGACYFKFEALNGAPPVRANSTPAGLLLGVDSDGNLVGGTYRVHLRVGGKGNYPNQKIELVDFIYGNTNWGKGKFIMKAASATPEIGDYKRYPGSNVYYIWHVHEPSTNEAYIDLEVPANCPININKLIVKSFFSAN